MPRNSSRAKKQSPKSNLSKIVPSRKQKRKDARKQKKVLKKAFFLKKTGKQDVSNVAESCEARSKTGHIEKESKQSSTDKIKKLKECANKKRKKMLKQANKDEELNIKKLEKQLNLFPKKKKSDESRKSISKSFQEDGLDYILEACDSEKLNELGLNDSFEDDSEDSSEEEVSLVAEQDQLCDEDANSETNDSLEDSFSDDENEHGVPEEEEEEEIEHDNQSDSSNEIDEQSKDDAVESETDAKVWEDIYGRKRDAQGNIVQTKYVPPALRAQNSKNDLSRLEKQLKGQLNRLAESNLQSISRVIEDLYGRNSRNDMNVCLIQILRSSILLPNALAPERLAMEHAALVAILHANIGTEVGATVTQKWIEAFVQEYEATDMAEEDKSTKILDNFVYFSCFLYSFRVIGHSLIFDLFQRLVDGYSIKDIELILLLLRTVGFNLRKDDPSKLKCLIVDLQKKAASDQNASSGRVKFMLECLLAIKNNNVKKLPNYDPTYQVHLAKILKNFLRPGAEVTPLIVRLDDLLKADTRGRWWIVGSAWAGREAESNESSPAGQVAGPRFSEELQELARKMRMNTDVRRTMFCTLMSSNDFMEAYEKLLKLDVKSPSRERDSAFVLTLCCVKEPRFNPFYPHVAAKLARHDRKFRMAVQCAIWDRISNLIEGKLGKDGCVNLALFTSLMIQEKVLTLTCLKKIEFADMNKHLILYMRTLVKNLLAEDNERERVSHFSLIAANKKLSVLKDSLQLFMDHFMLRGKKEMDVKLKTRVEEAKQALLIR